jgi:predicted small metal-binding protein
MGIPNEETNLIRYACKDMGLKCAFVVKGETVEEVTKRAFEHVRDNHANEFNKIGTPAEIQQMETSLARSMREI